ncbi:hypothetical protein TgHK011_008189 [Trichoderma gracile]|nr:hypothetical protein TgHK011_008189 [Trichoderma gracile]
MYRKMPILLSSISVFRLVQQVWGANSGIGRLLNISQISRSRFQVPGLVHVWTWSFDEWSTKRRHAARRTCANYSTRKAQGIDWAQRLGTWARANQELCLSPSLSFGLLAWIRSSTGA